MHISYVSIELEKTRKEVWDIEKQFWKHKSWANANTFVWSSFKISHSFTKGTGHNKFVRRGPTLSGVGGLSKTPPHPMS